MSKFDDFQEFGFGSGDESINQGEVIRFKGKKDEHYRISIAWWEIIDGRLNMDAETPKFTGCNRIYLQGVGYVRVSSEEIAKFGEKDPRLAIGTIIVKWPTKVDTGALNQARFRDGDFEVMYWIFAEDKYKTIKPIHDEWHLGQSDLKVHCIGEQFQKMTFSPTKKNLLRDVASSDKPILKEMYARIVAEVEKLSQKVQAAVARDMTPEEIRSALGRSKANGATNPAAPAIASAASSDDVDDLIDGFIDA